MTTVAVVLIGVGVVLIASALDNTPIISTFQKIINGDVINWSGNPQGNPTSIGQQTSPPYVPGTGVPPNYA